MALIINGEPVGDELLEQEFANIKASYEALDPQISCCERDSEFRGYARDTVVARVLLAQEARRRVDEPEPAEVDRAVEELKAEHGGAEKFYAAFHLTSEQDDLVREDVRLNLKLQRLLDGICAPLPEPAEAELRRYYEAHLDRFMKPEQVRASHILRSPRRSEEREQAYERLRDLRERLLEGADFDAMAREHSDRVREGRDRGEDEQEGIDLGHFERGQLMPEFETVAFSMRVGEVSPIFSSAFGYHLVKLTDRVPAHPRPFEEVREEVEQQFLEDHRREKVQAYVEQLKTRASIEESGEG